MFSYACPRAFFAIVRTATISNYRDTRKFPSDLILHVSDSFADTIRSCRTEKSGYYTEDPTDRCKKTSLPGEYRCWCFSDWCNGKEQDVRFNEYLAQQSGGGTGSGTTKKPSSVAVSLRTSGQTVLGFMILTLLQNIAL